MLVTQLRQDTCARRACLRRAGSPDGRRRIEHHIVTPRTSLSGSRGARQAATSGPEAASTQEIPRPRPKCRVVTEMTATAGSARMRPRPVGHRPITIASAHRSRHGIHRALIWPPPRRPTGRLGRVSSAMGPEVSADGSRESVDLIYEAATGTLVAGLWPA